MPNITLALTTSGKALKAKIEEGAGTLPLKITRIVSSADGSGDPLNMSADDVTIAQTFDITGSSSAGERTIIRTSLTNAGNPNADPPVPPLAAGYDLVRIWFFAEDPDEGEITYRVTQLEKPIPIPAASERFQTFRPTFNINTGNASEVIIVITPEGFVTREEMTAYIDERLIIINNEITVINSKIEDILNKLSSLSGFTISGIVPTRADLSAVSPMPPDGELWLVQNDETLDGGAHIYESIGGAWIYVAPFGFSVTDATQDEKGIGQYATQAEANALTALNRMIAPGTIPRSSETQQGISRRATQAETNAGVNDDAHITPLKHRNAPLGDGTNPGHSLNDFTNEEKEKLGSIDFSALGAFPLMRGILRANNTEFQQSEIASGNKIYTYNGFTDLNENAVVPFLYRTPLMNEANRFTVDTSGGKDITYRATFMGVANGSRNITINIFRRNITDGIPETVIFSQLITLPTNIPEYNSDTSVYQGILGINTENRDEIDVYIYNFHTATNAPIYGILYTYTISANSIRLRFQAINNTTGFPNAFRFTHESIGIFACNNSHIVITGRIAVTPGSSILTLDKNTGNIIPGKFMVDTGGRLRNPVCVDYDKGLYGSRNIVGQHTGSEATGFFVFTRYSLYSEIATRDLILSRTLSVSGTIMLTNNFCYAYEAMPGAEAVAIRNILFKSNYASAEI
jgi:hypothetical protein